MPKFHAEFLTRFKQVRQTGPDQYVACCPAHNDRSPSLSIKLTQDGTVLLHCFAGCDSEDVLAAVGMSFADLYPDNPDKAAYQAAVRNQGSKYDRLLDQRALDLMVLKIAKADLETGRPLSLEDKACLELAKERLKGST